MRVDIAYSTDQNYVPHLGVSLVSLFENNRDIDEIFIHILDNGIVQEDQEKMRQTAEQYGRHIFFYAITDLMQDLIQKYQIPNTISISAYGRLFLSELLDKQITKVLYLDCDSLVLSSLLHLWQMDVGNHSIMGVWDHVGKESKIAIGLDEKTSYINSGFLLINLDAWRTTDAVSRMITFIGQKNGNVHHHDQGVINACFFQEIKLLHPRYNVMTSFYDFANVDRIKYYYQIPNYYAQKEIDEAKQNPVFLHFTPCFSKRPWVVGCRHPLKSKYQFYLEKSLWQGRRLEKDTRAVKVKILESVFWTFGPKLYKTLFA